jgi:hypothetical protein
VIALALLAAGCGTAVEQAGTPVPATPPTTQAATTAPPAAPTVPPEPVPAADGACPYLETGFVEEANGQQVSKVRLSADDPPACFFYRGGDREQLRIHVVTGDDVGIAKAVVDRAAPVASSDPATLPGGWEGGKQPTDTGAVFAVAKRGTAVVVVTNQQQTIKASRVAERVIITLGL